MRRGRTDDPDVGMALRERRRGARPPVAAQRDPAVCRQRAQHPNRTRTPLTNHAAEAADDRHFGVINARRRTIKLSRRTAADACRPAAAVADAMEDDASSGSASRPMPLASSCAS